MVSSTEAPGVSRGTRTVEGGGWHAEMAAKCSLPLHNLAYLGPVLPIYPEGLQPPKFSARV